MTRMTRPPAGSTWLRTRFDPAKAAPGYQVAADGVTVSMQAGGRPYHTVQATHPIGKKTATTTTSVDGTTTTTANRFYCEALFTGLVGGFGVSHLNDPLQLNLYNDPSYLLSGYGDLYHGGSSVKGYAPNMSRSSNTRYAFLLDRNEGSLQYWVNGQALGVVTDEAFTTKSWYVTATFGSGAEGAVFALVDLP
jgi:hypothetical protein